ncbi:MULTISPECIES: DeoR/GlpR family DNA-binding transcription regulator [unclassified Fusibacter]|uniref:DeoR/GlpR family DNA-binding transcription regulator n=1 Tax=unclassified Fusibacter TaxID=2624464 RepID=UPI0013E9722B|nr:MULTISPECIES: DeoR/GlpR family DNA-binding transcription regulator [unclassified Fusibacter]MCK8060413.1 DeoR/GlpR family DNA-binding transcription regulator [Fusibacter sp. A2]NPE20298.1 DeoR/GlpR transcriptional regulator [Fusibacter sp. A1]
MKASDRSTDIIKKLNRHGRISVKELAIDYRITEDLVRKDLKKLEKQGLLDRVYGGAERKKNKFEAQSIHYRVQVDEEDKASIAKKAVQIITNGEYIFLDTSSTSVHIAKELARSNLEVTVVTDMLEITNILSVCEDVTLIAIGGIYNTYTGGFEGPEAISQIRKYAVDKAFVSCRSVDLHGGDLIEGFVDIGNTKKVILDIARTKIISTTANKYRSSGIFKFYRLEAIDYVITEKEFDMAQLNKLKEYKIKAI